MHSSFDCLSCVCLLVAPSSCCSVCVHFARLSNLGITNPDYRMPMRIRAISFSFPCLLCIEYAAIRATDRLRSPYTQDLFFDKRTLIVVINSTLQHVHPFSALHCAMTAVQCAPHKELLLHIVCERPCLADALRGQEAQCAEHIPFGELSPSHCTTALLYYYAPRVGLKYERIRAPAV